MAAELKTIEYTFPSTAAVSLTTILGLTTGKFVSTLSVRANGANAKTIAWGSSAVTLTTNRGGYLNPGDTWGFDLQSKFVSSQSIYFIGQANDVLHVTVLD